MIALDTNVILRNYVNDDAQQHSRASKLVEENEIFINNLVLLEMYWVLMASYSYSMAEILETFHHMLSLRDMAFESRQAFARACYEVRNSGCEFDDALIGAVNLSHGLTTFTFDKGAASLAGFERA